MSKVALVTCLLLFATVQTTRAQELLHEAKALRQLLESHPTLQAAVLDVEQARAHVRGERARYPVYLTLEGNASGGRTPELTIAQAVLPYQEQVGGGAEISRTFPVGSVVSLRFDVARKSRSVPFFVPSPVTGMPTARLIDIGPGYYYDGTFAVTQPLLRGFGHGVGELELRAAHLELSHAQRLREQTASQLVRDAMFAYWELWYAQAARRLAVAALKTAEQEHDGAKRRAEAGTLARVDVLELATRVAQLKEEESKAELLVAQTTTRLAELIGHDLRSDLRLELSESEPPSLAAPTGDDVERALAQSPALAEARAAVAVSEERGQVAGEALRPQLDLTGKVAVHGLGNRNAADGIDQLTSMKAVTALATLSYQMPLNRTQQRMDYRKAKLEIEAQLARTRQLERDITREVIERQAEDRRLLEQLTLSEESARIGRELAEAARERFAQGALTALDVVLAQQKADEAALRVTRLRVDLLRSRVERLHLTGRLTERYARVVL